jgi:hypothetical protein
MKPALVAIVLTLGFAAPAGTDSAAPRQDGAAPRPVEAARPDGRLVLAALSPERVLVANPRTGRTRERELPGGTLCHGPLVVTAGRVVFFDWDGRSLVARAARIGGLGDDESVGSAAIAVPSATPGRLWLGGRRGGSIHLREVGPRGELLARARTPVPRWDTVHAQVGGEFLTTHGTGLVLGGERFEDAWLVAAQGERFAWCGDPCGSIGIWSGGRRGVLAPPRGIVPRTGPAGAFTPGGERLALSVTVAGKPRFAVVDVARNDWSIVPRARPGIYAALAWSPSGRWLYLADKRERLLASRDGSGRPRTLPIDTGGTVMSIAATG